MYFPKPNKKDDGLCKLIEGKKNNLIKNVIVKSNCWIAFRITLIKILM